MSLAETTIVYLKKEVKEHPEIYDANKLQDAIDKVNSMSEEELNCNLLLGRIQDLCVRDDAYNFSEEELSIVRQAIIDSGLNITKEERLTKDDPSRDDYAFVTSNDTASVIWIGKIKPLFDSGDFVVLGIGMHFPNNDYDSIEELSDGLKKSIKDLI